MAEKEIAVSVKDIHKNFVLPHSKNTTMKQTVVNIVRRNNRVTQKVLDGVSFDVYKGDFFGVVGRNGSGKSTLLKLLAGVYVPTSGEIQINGKLTPFIELGVGFNPELSGRDNVYLNGALLGFNRKQMNAMYNEIVEFAELEPFMDQKLKNYSSGMQVRLAFSIAIKAKNDVLIFDEVLAVGDEAFQRKCLDVFEQYKANGQTVILVSHDMETIRRYCNRAILIHNGKLIEDSNPRKVADKYSAYNQEQIDNEMGQEAKQQNVDKDVDAIITDSRHKPIKSFITGTNFNVDVSWKQNSKVDSLIVNIFRKSGEHITAFRVKPEGEERAFSVNLSPLLSIGRYSIRVELRTKDNIIEGEPFEGADFMITQQDIPGVPGWSGLISVPYTVSYGKPPSKHSSAR